MSDQTRTGYGGGGSYGSSYGGGGTYGSSYGTSYDPSTNQPIRQAIKFMTASTIGVSFLILSGLILTGTVIGLIIATPLLVIFSPILVPAAITLTLAAGGFLFSGGCGVAAIAALSWLYSYVTGKHPAGSDRLDYAKGVIADKARDVKDRAKDYAGAGRAQEGTQGY
ncbi:oleosin Ara h 15.0101 [Arachis duranensis]|uniref:Oleosin n=1 Tax=Arachis duranensis TaxID=130453 RepID=A0A6P4C115_ARADU|nr:oleosin Ara h 15.0101 [Arachis duranensis]